VANSNPVDRQLESMSLLPGALTVIIPNLNHCAFLPISIGSALRQSRRPERVLVLDDGSDDGSVGLVQRHAASEPLLELMLNPRRLYVNGSINRGLSLTRTEFVTFLAADDFVDEHLYDIALACLRAHPGAAFCATGVQWIDEGGMLLAQPADPEITREPAYLSPGQAINLLARYGSYLSGTGCVFRTELLRAVDGFDPELGSYADNFAQQMLAAKHGLCYAPGRLAYWRRIAGSYSNQTNRTYEAGLQILKAVEERITNGSEDLFPRAYSNRLLRRLSFDVARTALSSEPPRVAEAAALMPSHLSNLVLRLIGRRFGLNVSIFALLLLLRPFDLIFAVQRRLKIPYFPRKLSEGEEAPK
jgi:glycosyltransferase involved in cell wall biosynthesis